MIERVTIIMLTTFTSSIVYLPVFSNYLELVATQIRIEFLQRVEGGFGVLLLSLIGIGL